jgi:predicted lipid-binding transport protein (Tim44 family)
MTWTEKTLAQAGISVQFLALVRTLGEYFRLKYVHGAAPPPAMTEPLITGALITSICAGLAVGLYFAGKYKATVGVAMATVLILLGFKIWMVGW